MKYLILFFSLFFLGHSAFSQDTISYHLKPDLKQKMIQLALQNKELEIADHEVNVSKFQLKQSKRWWLDEISLSFNANEFTVKRLQNKGAAETPYNMYPLYNFGVNIPIGQVFTKSMSVKAAKEQVAISEAQRDIKYMAVKSEVLSTYADYVQSKKLYALQLKSTESVYNEFLQAKSKFKSDEISLDRFNAESSLYDQALKNKIVAEHNYQIAKIALEKLIGISMEDFFNNYK